MKLVTVGNPSLKRLFFKTIRANPGIYAAGFFSVLITNISEVFAPKVIQWVVDLVATGRSPHFIAGVPNRSDQLVLLLGVLSAAALVGALGRFLWRQTLARSTHQATRELKRILWQTVQRTPLATLRTFSFGDIMNRAISDVHTARAIFGFTLVLTFDLSLYSCLAFGSMFFIDVYLASAVLVCFLFLPPVLTHIAKKEFLAHEEAQQTLGNLSESIAECTTGLKSSKTLGRMMRWTKVLGEQASLYARRRIRLQMLTVRSYPLCAFPIFVAQIAILVLGIPRIRNGQLSLGELIAFQSYVLILQGPFNELGELVCEWQRGFASFGRIISFIRSTETTKKILVAGAVTASKEKTTVIDAAPSPLASDESRIVIHHGEKLGLSGNVGSGKTTFLLKLAGLLPSDPGEIYLNGQDINALSTEQVRNNVQFIAQQPFIFAGTLRHNMCLGDDLTDEEIWKCLHDVALDHYVSHLPSKLETWIGEGGVNLSGGQRQRLAFARQLARIKPILLIDDALNAVDAETMKVIAGRLDTQFVGRTVLWISHRSDCLSICDRQINWSSRREGVSRVIASIQPTF